MVEKDLYQVLGLPIHCTPEEIRLAYFDAAKRYHPDTNHSPDANEQFIAIQQAYDILSVPQKKVAYDQSLPKDAFSKNISIKFHSSRSKLRIMAEPQLIYALLEIENISDLDKNNLPCTHICLVIDRSTSMEGERMDMVKKSVVQLFRKMRPKDYISVVSFSDRAEVVLPPTQINSLDRFEFEVALIRPGGGTEIFQGLDLGLRQIKRLARSNIIGQVILVTDGHTYGDEQACLDAASQAASEGIIINALGIGNEWNDEFLETISSRSGGKTFFATSPQEIPKMIKFLASASQWVYSRNLEFHCVSAPPAHLNYLYQVHPVLQELKQFPVIQLGHIIYQSRLLVLFEIVIKQLPEGIDRLQVINGMLQMELPDGSNQQFKLDLTLPVSDKTMDEYPPSLITDALSKVTLFRLQERAKQEVASGNHIEADKHLQYLATRLLSRGERELAHTILSEAEHIRQTHSFTRSGDKRIKYGTRGLSLPAKTEADAEV